MRPQIRRPRPVRWSSGIARRCAVPACRSRSRLRGCQGCRRCRAGAAEVSGHVAEVSCATDRTAQQAAARDDGAADAGSEGEEDDVVQTACRTVGNLAEQRGVGVIDDRDLIRCDRGPDPVEILQPGQATWHVGDAAGVLRCETRRRDGDWRRRPSRRWRCMLRPWRQRLRRSRKPFGCELTVVGGGTGRAPAPHRPRIADRSFSGWCLRGRFRSCNRAAGRRSLRRAGVAHLGLGLAGRVIIAPELRAREALPSFRRVPRPMPSRPRRCGKRRRSGR